MKKKQFVAYFLLVFFWLPLVGLAAGSASQQQIPEKDGEYDVPGHPEMKVRVFVHKARPAFNIKEKELLACSDLDSTAIVKSAGWKIPNTTWKYWVNSTNAPDPTLAAEFENITKQSFDEWGDGTELLTVFERTGSTEKTKYALDGENIVTWGSASSNALAVTYTWYNRKTKLVVENDTIMNKAFSWSWSDYLGSSSACGDPGSYDTQNILTHEIGHWVGLNDHYTAAYANNTMYGYGSKGEVKKDSLTTGDIAGVGKIY